MASFYGNIKNNSRVSFIFDKIYSSRSDMEKALAQPDKAGTIIGDGIFTHRYVLIDYGFVSLNEQKEYKQKHSDFNIADTDIWVNRYELQTEGSNQETTGSRIENIFYAKHRTDDIKYKAEYDQTVWMKIYTNNVEKYIMVARLKAEAPAFEMVPCAPGGHDGVPHFDLLHSTDINYKYHVPVNWKIAINNYDPTKDPTSDSSNGNSDKYKQDSKDYALYEIGKEQERTYHKEHEYPYFNQAGFKDTIQHKDTTDIENFVDITEASSGTKYPKHIYSVIQLTANTYTPNQYYIINNNKYTLATGDFDSNETYYICTVSDTELESSFDTKRVDIHIPAIGNMVSDGYDILYGKPYTSGLYTNSIIGYKTNEPEGQAYIHCKINNDNYYLTPKQYRELSHVYNVPKGYEIEVKPQQRFRPYKQEELYDLMNVDPYNNLKETDPISVAWALDNLKHYISELRYLARGSGIVGYTNADIINNKQISEYDEYEEIQLTADAYVVNQYYIKQSEDKYKLADQEFDSDQIYYIQKKMANGKNFHQVGGLSQAEFDQLKGSPLYTYSSNVFQQVTATAVNATTIYYIKNIDGAYSHMNDGSFLIQGNYDPTSAIYVMPTTSDNTSIPWIYNITDNNKDKFEHFQLTDTQVSRLNKNYDRELYPIPIFRERGLQSDWTLSDPSSFGYVYNKPPCLWANEDYYQSDNYTHMYTPLYSNTDNYAITAYSTVTLTNDDYIPNKYYILENDSYILSTTAVFSIDTTYYEKNTEYIQCMVNNQERYLTSEEYKNLQQESSDKYKIPVVVLESTPLPETGSGLTRHSIEYIYDNYKEDDLWNFPT